MAEQIKVYLPKVKRNLKINIKDAKLLILDDMAQKSDQYVPEDTGKTRIEMEVDTKNNQIIWSNEYVEYIYWGIDFNFHKDKNIKSQAQWADRAIEENIDKWAEDYIDKIMESF